MESSYKQKNKSGTVLAAVVVIGLLAPLLAAIGAFVGPYATLFFVGLIAASISFSLPLNFLVFICFLVGSVFAGLLDYFAGVSQAFWLPYLMGALFALRAIVERLGMGPTAMNRASPRGRQAAPPLHPVTWIAAAYFAVAIFGALMALPPLLQVLVATKNYFFLWGVLIVLLWGQWRIADSTRLWSILVMVACLQWPVAMYQRFVIAAGRRDAAAWDAVVGTFGGNPEYGGHSAAMAFVSCLAIAALVWRMREKKLNLALGGLLVLASLVPIALAEVKAAFVWLAVVFLVLFARQIGRQPFRAGLTLLFGVTLLVGLSLAYKATYQDQRGGATSLQEIYDKQIKYSLDPNEYRSDLKRLGRITAIVYWWERHDLRSDPVSMLVGHGIGASRSTSSLAIGDLARKLPFPVDNTAASTLLWDLGLLGALLFFALLVVAAIAALRLSQRNELAPPWRESTLLAACVLAMASLGLLYNKDAIDQPVIQTLIYFSIAQVMLARREFAACRTGKRTASGLATATLLRPNSAPLVIR